MNIHLPVQSRFTIPREVQLQKAEVKVVGKGIQRQRAVFGFS